MALPANVGTCLVTGTFIRAVIDSVDADRDPDGVPIEGLTVKFTASVPMVRNVSAVPPVMVFIDPIMCTTDATGTLIGPDDQSGILLVASDDPDLDPSGWTYRAELSAPTLPKFSFSFVAPVGGAVDLSTVVPVPPSPGAELVAWQVAVTTTEAARDEALVAVVTAEAARDEALVAVVTAEAARDEALVAVTETEAVRDETLAAIDAARPEWWAGTQAEYDALATIEPDRIYLITAVSVINATWPKWWLGTQAEYDALVTPEPDRIYLIAA